MSRSPRTEFGVKGAGEEAGAKANGVGERVGVVGAVGIENELSFVDGQREWYGFSLFVYPRVGF